MEHKVDDEILQTRKQIQDKLAQGEKLTALWSYILVCDTMDQVKKC